ncbi:MAG: PD-(D/E)XK nuclease family protein [Gammaproteobacteria bacterium]|nr:PD-(D/E)XK nuclease family protein [Gammaproteobacteria bacterium]
MCALQVIPYGEDPLRRLAQQLIETHRDTLPKLTDVIVLLPTPQASLRFRQVLLEIAADHQFPALLGPTIDTLPRWVNQQSITEQAVLSEHQRELMLVEALISHPWLYGQGNPWTLADSLLELFDELGATHLSLPETLDPFVEQLAGAYGLERLDHDSLVGEARLVHSLWQAWHQQMHAAGVIDRHTDQLLKLAACQASLSPRAHFYIAGLGDVSPAQAHWLRHLLARQQAEILLQASPLALPDTDYHPARGMQDLLQRLDSAAAIPAAADNPYGQCLDSIYSDSPSPLRLRASACAQDFPHSPVAERIAIFAAGNAEREAQAIDLQVRLWWHEGKRNIGIVTENRRLARRTRALLERSGINLQDAAGWALSTTSAAATLERWLETLEDDFAYQPLLDLLKSPYLLPGQDREARLSCVYRFEQGVVLKENVARNLNRYRQHLRYRQNRLPADMAADYDDIHLLLDELATAASPLLDLTGDTPHPPGEFLAALATSLERLGLSQSFTDDAAGQRILQELQQMQAATQGSNLRMRWSEFRTWLGRTLERFNFQPPAQTGQVQLMSLGQSVLSRFDALIIAGCEAEYLPGTVGGSPFFNDGVRQALGLSGHSQRLSEKFHQFRCLLESADRILLTHRQEQDGEAVVASAWLQRLQSFHQLAYDDDLIDQPLTQLVNHGNLQVTRVADPLPQPMAAHPTARIGAELFPEFLSASGYQQLINCPYQFFAARCLKLEPPELIREMLAKADYGERVHLCLQAFHHDVSGLPGPFASPLSDNNRSAAVQCLHDIAVAVFARDLEDNFLHRGWLKRWQLMIPEYIDWQFTRQQDWQVKSTELTVSTPRPNSTVTLRGRLDRIDAGVDAETGARVVGIIDYKTGAIPDAAEVLSGESVQLPFYALLAESTGSETVTRVEYLALDERKDLANGRPASASRKTAVKTVGTLETETLESLKDDIAERLDLLVNQIQTGEAMPAWGDEVTCAYCQMSGLCRRQAWQE